VLLGVLFCTAEELARRRVATFGQAVCDRIIDALVLDANVFGLARVLWPWSPDRRHLKAANLKAANLSGADLAGVNLSGANRRDRTTGTRPPP
jgi:uncharacterized protein YjbI with pentapeptide repeats